MTAPLARCGPLSLLAASFLMLTGAATVRDLPGALVGLGIEVVVLVVAVAGRFPLWRLLPAALAVASIAWSNWLLADPRSLEAAAVAGLRVAFFVVPGIVLVSFIDPGALGDHLGQRLRLPARPVLASTAALQRLEALADDWVEVEAARRVRGLAPGRSPLARVRHVTAMTFALLVGALRSAARMTVAMQARGYSAHHDGGPPRTWAHPAPWRPADTALVLSAAALAASPLIARIGA